MAQLPDGDILVAGVTTDADNEAFRSLTKPSEGSQRDDLSNCYLGHA